MARGFNTTVGSGTTDAVESALTTYPAQRSCFIWTYRNDDGGNGFGRMFSHTDASGNNYSLFQNGVGATTYNFNANFSIAGGSWTFTRPSASAWHSLGVSYDNSATTNDPTIFLDTTKLTVGSGLTETITPNGTRIDLAGVAMGVGNRLTDKTRAWDGYLAEFAVWNALLDDAEFTALAKGYSPLLIRTGSLVEYIPLVRENVSRKLAAPTITGTTVRPHPRIIMPHRRNFYRKATAAGFIPAWAQNSNLPVIGAGTH